MVHVVTLLAALLLVVPARAADAPPAKPNILFIAVDDLNHWVGHLNRNPQTKTPNIDKLAARGVTFTRAYCPAPVCNPSRAALMSGRRPGSTGVYDNNDDFRPVNPPEQSLISTFRHNGYLTVGCGKIYHGGFDRKTEWDAYLRAAGGGNQGPAPANPGVGGIKFGPVDAPDDAIPDHKIVDYAIDHLKQKHDKPFLLTVGLHKPHMPWYVPKKYYDLHPLDQIQLPPTVPDDLADIPPAGLKMAKPEGDHKQIVDSGRWKEAVQGYLAAVSYCDYEVGRLIEAFDASPHKDNTIVVFFGDHGWHLGEKQHWRKFTLWEEATRAPFIWVAPSLTKPNTRCDTPVDFMSIYPTLTDLAAIPTPKHVEGRSIRPLLADAESPWATPAITTHGFNNHAVRTAQYRYIRYANGDEELYDHAADPLEHANLASKPEHVQTKTELARHLPATNVKDLGGKPRNQRRQQQKKQDDDE